jgi:hypothetical protein
VQAQRVDFLAYRGGPFEALLFTRSLHHVSPLEDALAHAHALLSPGGALICDEFSVDGIDPATAAWVYDLPAALEAAGALQPDPHEHKHGPPVADPAQRWRQRHTHHDDPLHGAEAMLEAISRRFTVARVERLPYLHRYFSDRLPETDGGAALFRLLREREALRVNQKILAPVGLRIVATRA